MFRYVLLLLFTDTVLYTGILNWEANLTCWSTCKKLGSVRHGASQHYFAVCTVVRLKHEATPNAKVCAYALAVLNMSVNQN